jgi:hypothetical protein
MLYTLETGLEENREYSTADVPACYLPYSVTRQVLGLRDVGSG